MSESGHFDEIEILLELPVIFSRDRYADFDKMPLSKTNMELVNLETIKNALPESQLRHSGNWLFSPQPLALDKKTTKALTQLGHPLAQFQRASDSIYQRSAKGNLPAWIHHLLDA